MVKTESRILGPDGQPLISRASPAEIEQYKADKGEQFPEPDPIGTFVKDRAVAERMLAGARRHLNSLGDSQAELRSHAIRLSPNELRGAVRKARRQERRKAFKGSEGFDVSARFTRKPTGPSEKVAARQRAREFNTKHGEGQDGVTHTAE